MSNIERRQPEPRTADRYTRREAILFATALISGSASAIMISDIRQRSEEYGYAKRDVEQTIPKPLQAAELERRFPTRRDDNEMESFGIMGTSAVFGVAMKGLFNTIFSRS